MKLLPGNALKDRMSSLTELKCGLLSKVILGPKAYSKRRATAVPNSNEFNLAVARL